MKTFAITVKNKKQERLLIDLASELGLDIAVTKIKPLTTKEIALGIGRNFTETELTEYLHRTYGGKGKTASNVLKNIKKAHKNNSR